jgi:hypothetical protein
MFTERNGRLRCHPSSGYKTLSDADILFLRHHRADIRNALRDAGPHVQAATPTPSESVAPTVVPAPEPARCKWCNRAPCIGAEHPAFFALHPNERQKHADEQATKEMMARIGKPSPWD